MSSVFEVQANGRCPLSRAEVVETYFSESRNKLLELAAFFDRIDRARDGSDAGKEPRAEALRRATELLLCEGAGRVEAILLALSDTTVEPLQTLDRKGALGAYLATDGEG